MVSTEGLSFGRVQGLTNFGRPEESNEERLATCRDGAQHRVGGEFQSDLGGNGGGLHTYRCGSCGGTYSINTASFRQER